MIIDHEAIETVSNRDGIRWTRQRSVCKENFFLTESVSVESPHGASELRPAGSDWHAFAFVADTEIAAGEVESFGDIESLIESLEPPHADDER